MPDDVSTPGPLLMPRERDPDEIERIARVGSWTLDPATGQATWSAEMFRILGVDPTGPAVDLPDISQLFTPDSVSRIGAAVTRAIETGAGWHEDLELTDGRGQVSSSGIAVADAAGVVTMIRGTMQDVTEQRALEAQLRQAQRLESVGRLAGGIAHDFNNILTALRGYASLARAEVQDETAIADDLDHVIANADRAAELVRQLLAFSRSQVLAPQVLDPVEVIEGLMPLLRRLLGEGVELSAVHRPGLGRITVDPSQLGQVVVNLAVNARDAMPKGGKLLIETMNVELDVDYASRHSDVTAGRHVLIAVSDTGHGMDAATQASAFEPFFTTKGPDGGSGMGLATVHGIVRQSGGSIYLYSEPGRGTTFKLYFPRTDEVASVPAAESPDGFAMGGTETILLVEDDADVRGYARRVLEGAGFAVLEASDGAAAIDLVQAQPEPIALLLTDVVMPGMHGADLAAQLTAVRPGLAVIYVSGFTEDSVIRGGVVAEGVHFLPKPYRAEDLLRTVRRVLDGAV